MATVANVRAWLTRTFKSTPKCCCKDGDDPCAFLGTAEVKFSSFMGDFTVLTCHWHAGLLTKRGTMAVSRSDEALMKQRHEQLFGGNP
jgi:hypothetical protein